MPLPTINNGPQPYPAPKTVPLTIETPGVKHHLIDAKTTELATLITYMSGMSWIADVYSQLLSDSEQPTPWQPNQLGPYKQYVAIRSFELKLQAGMSPQHNTDQNTMSMSGTAHVHPCWKPHIYDMLVASIGDGRLGLFTITKVERLSLYKDAAHAIEFELVRELGTEALTALDKLVVNETFFQHDFLTYGQSPVLVQEQVDTKERLIEEADRLLHDWLSSFFSNEYGTLILPGQLTAVYDPFIVRAALDVLDVEDHPKVRRIKKLNMGDIPAFQTETVLDALIRQNSFHMPTGVWNIGLLSREGFNKRPATNSFYFSCIPYACFPTAPLAHVDNDFGTINPLVAETLIALEDSTPAPSNILPSDISDVPAGESPVPLPYFHPILEDAGYIFTAAFYNKSTTGQSVLELLVRSALEGEAIDTERLFAVVDARSHFGRLEHFYYDFILIILLRIALREV